MAPTTSFQVSAFHCMLQLAHRPKIEEVKVNLDLLQPLMDQNRSVPPLVRAMTCGAIISKIRKDKSL